MAPIQGETESGKGNFIQKSLKNTFWLSTAGLVNYEMYLIAAVAVAQLVERLYKGPSMTNAGLNPGSGIRW